MQQTAKLTPVCQFVIKRSQRSVLANVKKSNAFMLYCLLYGWRIIRRQVRRV